MMIRLNVRMFETCISLCVLAVPTVAVSAVFDEAPGAGEAQAYYGNWGVGANATSPAPNSYNNYRKRTATSGLALAEADANDPTLATWTNVYHPGSPFLQSPGMFIGQSPSTRSYADNVLFLEGLFDIDGGGKNGDSATRTEWDIRLGFLETPSEFVNERGPNNESWDLWAGDWASDGISFQLLTGASDNAGASPIGTTDNFVRGNAKGILFQTGNAPGAGFADERNREAFGTGIQTTAMTGFSPLGEIATINSNVTTGVGYNDRLQIEWWMEEVAGGDVTFNAFIGETLYQQSFDPNASVPNPTADPNNEFTEGFFDWQNATPVVFIGASGGTNNATGQMGFMNPNPTGLNCDFDGSGSCDLADLNELLYTGLSSGDLKYDLNNSGAVNLDDRNAFLREIDSLPGDADLNGVDNALDLNALGSNWQKTDLNSWADGDFNGDHVADAADLNDLGIWWTKSAADFAAAAAPAAASVPEPSAIILLYVGLVGLLARRRK